MKKAKGHKEIKNVVPNLWLHMIECWEYRDSFYFYYGIPGFGVTRSILIFITQVGITTLALFLGSILAESKDHSWGWKMLYANGFYFLLSIISIKMLQCTNKRHTLSQKPKSCLNARRLIGYSTCVIYWIGSAILWFRWCKESGYMNDDGNLGHKEIRLMIKDVMLMMVLDFPALIVYAIGTYLLFANPCCRASRTVSLREYRDMVHHNRHVQLAKERGISAIVRFERSDENIRPDDYVNEAFDNGKHGIVSI